MHLACGLRILKERHAVHASLHRFLGIDPDTTLVDLSGRPQYILDNHRSLPELG
ncbi:MAG: hypothetical protein KY476_02575 [Planctomycetes bacterium]|nr:hypothetical protein [Planctomycetota bacterium]